jgi:penicillin-binding protein 1A
VSKLREKLITVLVWFRGQTAIRKVLWSAAALAALGILSLMLLVLLVWTGALGSLPDKEELLAVQNPLATEVYSADSVLLGRYFVQERSDIRYADIPQPLEDALIATEDVRFYDHHGVDRRSMLRVLVKSIFFQNESSGGGSTIAQQLAKNLYPRKDYWFLSMPINKVRELIVASRLENVYDKKSLLTLYLNTIPFGDNTYGIEAAAQRFFSTHARALTPPQAAVLVGMLKATHAYNPRIFPDRSLQRRNVVLGQMKKYNKLPVAAADSMQALPLELKYNRITHHSGLAPYLREYIRPILTDWCKNHQRGDGQPYNLYTDGLKVYTTIDSRLQRYAEDAMRSQMAAIQKQFASHWGGKAKAWSANPSILKDAVKRSDRYKSLTRQGLSEAEIDKVMNTPVTMTRFAWDGEKEVSMSPMDSIKYYLTFLQAGLLAMEPSTGRIRAWVGGIDHHYFQYDHVRTSTKRQVGSTFKPIVYAAALERHVKPCEFISAEKVTYADQKNWTPENTEENYDLKFSMEGALAYSVNTVSVKVLEKAGIGNTIALARSMGIESELPSVPSLALGVSDLSVTEMTTAYACFVNNGKKVTPYPIATITDHRGQVLERLEPAQKAEQVMSPETAKLMVHMLKRTINEGTAAGIRSRYGVNNDMAGKTGTTQSNADGWFMAMMPDLVIGCWVGADDRRIRFRTTSLGQGAHTALPIVAKMISQANSDPTLARAMRAHFAPLPADLENDLSCVLYKQDKNLIERIFGKKDKEQRKDFNEKGQKKKGFFRRLFDRS